MQNNKPIIRAIVPVPVGFSGQTIEFQEIPFPAESISGVISYVTTPNTQRILECLGCTTLHGKFYGIQVIGQSYLAVRPLILLESVYDRETALAAVSGLTAILCTRIQ